jgi:hypothetical protein
MNNSDKWMLAIWCQNSPFEFMVTLLGSSSASTTFQYVQDSIIKGLCDKGVLIYIDDIFIDANIDKKPVCYSNRYSIDTVIIN